MSVWGNGKPDQYEENGRTYIAGIPKDAFDDFNFPSLSMDKVQAPVHIEKPSDVAAQTVNNYFKSETFYSEYTYVVNDIADWQTFLPIPVSVININPDIAQNTGY